MWDGAQVSSDPVNYLSRIEHEQRMAQVSPPLPYALYLPVSLPPFPPAPFRARALFPLLSLV